MHVEALAPDDRMRYSLYLFLNVEVADKHRQRYPTSLVRYALTSRGKDTDMPNNFILIRT